MKHDQKVGMLRSKSMEPHKPTSIRRISSRERKLALLQDVDRLKKKLKHEENVHRALERAFTRPLGTLPRLPAYLPPYTLELLAEVAVLEEEVVRLEEQIVHFRKGLYQEAVNISSSKKNLETSQTTNDSNDSCLMKPKGKDEPRNIVQTETNCTSSSKSQIDDGRDKENQSCSSSTRNKLKSPNQKPQAVKTPTKKLSFEKKTSEKRLDAQKSQLDFRNDSQDNAESRSSVLQDERKLGDESPNAITENILSCLLSIFSRMSTSKKLSMEKFPPFAALSSPENGGGIELEDPYDIWPRIGKKDIGPYKNLCSVDARTLNANRTANSVFLIRRLRILIAKLATVKLQRLCRLTHQEKLAFWINVYNSCMMNAYLEHGIPESPETVVALMQKATINVGGHQLNAITIEHFVLRLPYHSKYTFSKGSKKDDMVARSTFGLELSEPLVTFALSCGSWSSPAVRIYTAAQVENELEVAKREYLQAAVGVSINNELIIPKLLHWYLLDFAKDLESLLDWICLQLPTTLRKDAIKCLERTKNESLSQVVHIRPYEFSFRYLLHR